MLLSNTIIPSNVTGTNKAERAGESKASLLEKVLIQNNMKPGDYHNFYLPV